VVSVRAGAGAGVDLVLLWDPQIVDAATVEDVVRSLDFDEEKLERESDSSDPRNEDP
jgi:hypothetical protein